MGSLETAFALLVGLLAGLATVGALVFAVVWEWCAIRRTLAAHRRPTPEEDFWRQHAAVTTPERASPVSARPGPGGPVADRSSRRWVSAWR
jgi:hypothetical protein